MAKQSRVKGIFISYAATVIRTLSKLLLTPLYLRVLGLDEYGFYEYVFSVACYATILDFGISSVVNTFAISKRERGDNDGIENVLFYALMFSVGAAALIAISGVVIGIGAQSIFGARIVGRIALTRKLLALMVAELVMLMFQHYFEGIMLSAEKYVTLRFVALVQIILRCFITVLLLFSNIGVMSIAIGDLLGVGMCLLYEILYCKRKLHLRVRFHGHDPQMLRAISKLALALCLQSVVQYLNSSIDKYVLGRYISNAVVSIYSVALTFSTFFDEIPTAIQRLYLPQVVKMITAGASGEEMTDFVIKPGRYQFMLCGGILGGFILFGKDFIQIWSGKETLAAWSIALFLMIPSVLPLIQNVCLSILTAMNKRMFRSYVLCGIAVFNLFLTIILVKKIGLMGAPVATCISLILGNNIAMNIYYKKIIHINVRRLFANILKGILPCAILTTVICLPLNLLPFTGIIWFVAECGIFCLVYAAALWLFGMNADEKATVAGVIRKKLGRAAS